MAAVLTVIGGYNSNELLPFLDWELIRAHPKILCGYSDITALQNAILARAGLATYSGPHWSTFGMRDHFEQTLRWFTSVMFDTAPVTLTPASHWSDDLWFLDQGRRRQLAADRARARHLRGQVVHHAPHLLAEAADREVARHRRAAQADRLAADPAAGAHPAREGLVRRTPAVRPVALGSYGAGHAGRVPQ
ncbi:LD-carboxypeptidase [Nonomuraea sp. NPDC050383]|uniref:LD-carboxypeptidase n=1 Tax=Nonomuraea sp. NPDC050383 TaxID=3364362 RepID=UPI0037A31003